jgi:prevent-host-death family protein
MKPDHWSLHEAKNKLTEVIKCAQENGPQYITTRGHESAVLLSTEAYKKLLCPSKNIIQFFSSSPSEAKKGSILHAN